MRNFNLSQEEEMLLTESIIGNGELTLIDTRNVFGYEYSKYISMFNKMWRKHLFNQVTANDDGERVDSHYYYCYTSSSLVKLSITGDEQRLFIIGDDQEAIYFKNYVLESK